MIYRLCAVTLAGLVLTGCGSSHPSTRLRIEIANDSGVRAYRLTCGPDGGTVRQPRSICAALARKPNLLVGGRGLGNSCPGPGAAAYRISGSYRGHPIDATFGTPSCGWVPGQGDAYVNWHVLLRDPGRGVASRDVAPVALTRAERARRHELYLRRESLGRAAQRLARRRRAELAAGRLRLVVGAPPDMLARRVLVRGLDAVSLPNGPFPGSAKVYSTIRGRAGSVGAAGDLTRSKSEPVYVLLVRFSYRDYEGHRHLDPRSLATVMDARTLEVTDIAYGSNWDQPRLGSPTQLRLPATT